MYIHLWPWICIPYARTKTSTYATRKTNAKSHIYINMFTYRHIQCGPPSCSNAICHNMVRNYGAHGSKRADKS